MLDKEALVKDIRKAFATLSTYLQMGGKLNLTDAHVQSESFVQELLNTVYGLHLVSTNQTTANYPCIDLIDKSQKLGMQVSSDNSSAKINDTLTCLAKHGFAGTITKLKAFVLGKKQGQYTINSNCPGVSFNWENDVLDFDDVLKSTTTLPDPQIRIVHRCVVEAMPDIFPEHRAALAARQNDFRIRDHHNVVHSIGSESCRWAGPAMKPGWIYSDPARMSAPWIVAKFTEGASLELFFACGWGDQGTWLIVDRRTKEGVVLNHDQLRELRQSSATTTTTTTPPGYTYTLAAIDEEAKAWRAEYRRQLGNHLHNSLDRINREEPNFQKIRDKRATSGAHQKAVEEDSFELLAAQILKIKDANGYGELVAPMLTEIERIQVMPSGEKDVTIFLELLKPLKAKLETDVQGYPPPK